MLRYKTAGLSRGSVEWNDKYKCEPYKGGNQKKQGIHGNAHPFSNNYLGGFWMR